MSTPAAIRWLAQAWLIIALSLVFGGLLAGVHLSVAERIEANRVQAIADRVGELVPGAERIEALEVADRTVYRALGPTGQIGWLIPGSSAGFADRIGVVVGVDLAVDTITGLAVIEQKETPGLGDGILVGEWRDQFTGLRSEARIAVGRAAADGDQRVDAVTGATISSVAVADAINRAMQELREPLREVLP